MSCRQSEHFFEGGSFVEVIGKAISIDGDSDNIAAIAGSIAEVVYPIPQGVRDGLSTGWMYFWRIR